jgi:undecaprenyl diphosphate synthase
MHVAIIMDGNGRWAQKRGLERSAGHRAGARVVRRIVEAAARDERVDMLTLYAFSSDNWSRPSAEVETLMRLFNRYLRSEVARAVENGVRIEIIGRRDRLGDSLVDLIEQTENMTAAGQRLTLRLAVDYSARDAILPMISRPNQPIARNAPNGSRNESPRRRTLWTTAVASTF